MSQTRRLFKKTFAKIFLYTSFLFPFLWLSALVVSLVETYFYQGVVLKHTSFNPAYLYMVFAAIGLFSFFARGSKEGVFLNFFRRPSLLATLLFGVGFTAFNLLDTFKYSNFVFSTYHVQPEGLITSFVLSLYMYIVSSRNIIFVGYKNIKSFSRLKYLVMAILLWILTQNIYRLSLDSARDLAFMIKNPNASYDQKMEEKLGKLFYNYALFIKANTPENAKILLPPFPAYPWPQTGNYAYIRYFLYPRTVLNGNEYNAGHDLVGEGIDYVLIAWGETESTSGGYSHGWPKFNVKAEKITYMVNDGDKRRIEKSGDYIYDNVKNTELWGVIKVKK